jgi:hypothetical protein
MTHRPSNYLLEHRTEQQIENATFLMDTGSSIEEAARRAGTTVSALEKAMDRRKA